MRNLRKERLKKRIFQPFLGVRWLWLIFVVGLLITCQNGIEPTPNPGIIRVVLQSSPDDTFIVIVKDTFVVSEKDSFGVTVFQGKVYSGKTYAILYPNLKSYQQVDKTYNLLRRDGDQYHPFVIFESYVPPGNYDSLQFGLKATVLKLKDFDLIRVESPPDLNPIVNLPASMRVEENKITEVVVYLKPFQSIQRYRDVYRFIPKVQVVKVQMQP